MCYCRYVKFKSPDWYWLIYGAASDAHTHTHTHTASNYAFTVNCFVACGNVNNVFWNHNSYNNLTRDRLSVTIVFHQTNMILKGIRRECSHFWHEHAQQDEMALNICIYERLYLNSLEIISALNRIRSHFWASNWDYWLEGKEETNCNLMSKKISLNTLIVFYYWKMWFLFFYRIGSMVR